MKKTSDPDTQYRETLQVETRERWMNDAKRRLIPSYQHEDGTQYFIYQCERSFPVKRTANGQWLFQHPATDYPPDAEIPWHRFKKGTSQMLTKVWAEMQG